MSVAAVSIGPVAPERMLECELVARDVFGFSDRETVPAWHVYTSTLFGGVALAAEVDDRVVGFVFAFPAVKERRQCLFATELCVLPDYRSQGIGLRLLEALRRAAETAGYGSISLTTNALNSRNLYVYLARCGARLVAYRAQMYAQVLAAHAAGDAGADGDEAELQWDLAAPAAVDPSQPCERVEVPWEVDALAGTPTALAGWRTAVQESMSALLADGYQGVSVERDVSERRSFVVFQRGADAG